MRAFRYVGFEQARRFPSRPLRLRKRQRLCAPRFATLTRTRLTLPVASFPVWQSTTIDRPWRWSRRRVVLWWRWLMLERGMVVPAEQVPGGLGGVTGGVPGGVPGGFPPPFGVPPLLPLSSVPPAATAEGTTSSTGSPTFPASSTAWSRSTE